MCDKMHSWMNGYLEAPGRGSLYLISTHVRGLLHSRYSAVKFLLSGSSGLIMLLKQKAKL